MILAFMIFDIFQIDLFIFTVAYLNVVRFSHYDEISENTGTEGSHVMLIESKYRLTSRRRRTR